ncbi:MAG TPA: PqqD family protein [Pilimelia sp.]|nr:PqqD family protein [Pilimelia sp.]
MRAELLRPDDQVVWQDVPDAELVLLNPNTGGYYGLNATGGRLWRALASRPRSPDELVDELVAAYRVDRDTARADVARLVAALRDAGLVAATAAT